MSNNPAKSEVLIKQWLRSILDINVSNWAQKLSSFTPWFRIFYSVLRRLSFTTERYYFLEKFVSVLCLVWKPKRGARINSVMKHFYSFGVILCLADMALSRLGFVTSKKLYCVLATWSKFCLSGQLWNKICLSTFIDLLKFEVPMCFGVQVQVLAFLTVHGLLSVNQSGFRVKHSTETAIVISPIIF